MKIMFYY